MISPPSVDTKINCPPLRMARSLRASQLRASLDFPQLMLVHKPRLLTISCYVIVVVQFQSESAVKVNLS